MKVRSAASAEQSVRAININAAGIDLGSREHWVALPPGRAEQGVRSFECFTEDLEAMARWLQEHHIDTVAMESTGVYWVPVYQVLERHGLEVQLVNAKHFKTVPGRKTDVQDCQWLQHLHECGLLRGSFRPADAICVIRSYVRQRDTLVGESARHVQRMQKALEQMNLQLHKVVSDVTGETGLAIIKAVLAGERDPQKLAALRNYRCRRSAEDIAKALVGDWREEHLFCLRQALEAYEFVQTQIKACEEASLHALRQLEEKTEAVNIPAAKTPKQDTELRKALFVATGVDLTRISGLAPTTVQTLIAEVGVDASKWENEKAFASWSCLCPKNKITGGRRFRAAKQAQASRVGQAFRVAAQTLANSKTALGAFYRRMRARKGSTFANAVTAHKLAKLFYRMLKYGTAFVEQGAHYYEDRYKDRLTRGALHQLHRLGYDVQIRELPRLEPAVS
jgi:transposase